MTEYYIIIDDDPFNNLICKMAVENTLDNVNVTTFEDPEEALIFIQEQYTNMSIPSIVLLDINMPTMTGWQFLEEFAKFDEAIRTQFNIYIVSSSVDQRDIDRANNNALIKGMISKPIKKENILSIVNS